MLIFVRANRCESDVFFCMIRFACSLVLRLCCSSFAVPRLLFLVCCSSFVVPRLLFLVCCSSWALHRRSCSGLCGNMNGFKHFLFGLSHFLLLFNLYSLHTSATVAFLGGRDKTLKLHFNKFEKDEIS